MSKKKESDKLKSERRYYEFLSQCLQNKNFKEAINLINKSIKLDFFIDPRKIPNRFEIISNLLVDCIRTLNLGEIFSILRFVNKYNLVDKDLANSEIEIVNRMKDDNLFITNLIDLFGEVSNSFIFYVTNVMPFNLYNYYINYFSEYSFYSNNEYDVNLILNYLNEYNIYGLNVKLLGNLEDFLRSFKKKLKNKYEKFIEFQFANKTHLVSPKNILKNMEKIKTPNSYNFYSLSMVILHGIGPQGLGFTFSTPKGEIIEICSDIKENEAIIIKYKQFLAKQFLFNLKKELKDLTIDDSVLDGLNTYLLDLLRPKNPINYYRKDDILRKIKEFFNSKIAISTEKNIEFQMLISNISKKISKILRPIKMIDQFRVRMELVTNDKLRSEDIAKLTSLKEKSHFDILRERIFLQYIVEWFYHIYLEKNSEKKI